MANPDLEVIKDIPGYKVILKAVVRSQIQTLVEQLAAHTEEESIILTASVADGTLSHIGSESGKSFLEDHEDVKSQFLGFCLKYNHRKKQEQQERERQAEQERLQAMVAAQQQQFNAGPGPRSVARSPRGNYNPRYPSPRQATPGRSPGMRHEPYPVSRPIRRPAPPNLDQRAPVPSMIQRVGSTEGPGIKTEPVDVNEGSNQGAKDSEQAVTGSPAQNQNMKGEASAESKDDDAQSESSAATIPNTPVEGLSLDSDLSNLISGSADQPESGGPDFDQDVSVKLEQLTDADMELEITGVEPGRPVQPESWAGMQGNFDPNTSSFDTSSGSYDMSGGATGSPGDMTGGQQGYTSDYEQRKKKRLKMKAWRIRLKDENPAKFAEIKRKDSERNRNRRLRVKLLAQSDPDLQAKLRKKRAEAMKKYRQNKKLKSLTQ